MPNYMSNRLSVIGQAPDVKAFAGLVGEGSSLATLLPLPPEASKEIDLGGSKISVFVHTDEVNGRDMALDLWGTKWPDSEEPEQLKAV